MISIIIVVKNDRGIKDTLRGLEKIQKLGMTEVIVVDSSLGKIDDIRDQFPKVNWIPFIPSKNKKISIPEQRNVGVNASNGEIIVFIDANCIPNKDWLNALLYPILYNNENIVSGRTISAGTKTIHDQINDYSNKNQYLEECATINLAIKKIVFQKVGFFDERFDYGSDVDFAWRSVDSGYKIRYAKNATITHDWGDSKQETKRSYLYGVARARLYKKHVNRLGRLFQKDYFVLIYVVFILLLPITIFLPFYPLLLAVPFIKNIKKQPVRVIKDHLIYAYGFIKGILWKR